MSVGGVADCIAAVSRAPIGFVDQLSDDWESNPGRRGPQASWDLGRWGSPEMPDSLAGGRRGPGRPRAGHERQAPEKIRRSEQPRRSRNGQTSRPAPAPHRRSVRRSRKFATVTDRPHHDARRAGRGLSVAGSTGRRIDGTTDRRDDGSTDDWYRERCPIPRSLIPYPGKGTHWVRPELVGAMASRNGRGMGAYAIRASRGSAPTRTRLTSIGKLLTS